MLDQMATLKGTTGIKVKSGPTSSEYYIGLDENVTPSNNLSVRKAVLYAVNTSEITQSATFGYGIVLKSVIAPTIESYTPAFQNYTFNVTSWLFLPEKDRLPEVQCARVHFPNPQHFL